MLRTEVLRAGALYDGAEYERATDTGAARAATATAPLAFALWLNAIVQTAAMARADAIAIFLKVEFTGFAFSISFTFSVEHAVVHGDDDNQENEYPNMRLHPLDLFIRVTQNVLHFSLAHLSRLA